MTYILKLLEWIFGTLCKWAPYSSFKTPKTILSTKISLPYPKAMREVYGTYILYSQWAPNSHHTDSEALVDSNTYLLDWRPQRRDLDSVTQSNTELQVSY